MSGSLLDGKALAQKVRDEVRAEVTHFVNQYKRPPGLEVILVGEDPASIVYTRNKEKASQEVGMRGRLHRLPATTTEQELLDLIDAINDDDTTDGILVQLPLPKHIREDLVLETILPEKDVDGFHPVNAGLLATGKPALVPCTPTGCMRLIKETGIQIEGAKAVIVGRSNIVGKPMAALLLAANATVTIAHSKTKNLPDLCREADILIAAVGKPKMIKGDWIKPGATVIDVGINRDENGKLCGDVDTEPARKNAAFITPVPGGVGPMTIACLLQNTLDAAKRRLKGRAQ